MKQTAIFLFLIAYLANNGHPSDNQLWLADFEQLKSGMAMGYANLKYAREKENIDLSLLNRQTMEGLTNAKNRDEAQQHIEKFLKVFKDGHLRVRKWSPAPKNGSHPVAGSTLPTDSAQVALDKMAYEHWKDRPNIRYDSLVGYTAIPIKDNPFPIGTFKNNDKVVGVLRIGFFGHWRYRDIAADVWEAHRKTFDGPCNGECEWNFTKKVERELTRRLIESIETLNALDIDALIVDVSGNGGGSEWYEAVARLFSNRDLKNVPFFFAKHTIWQAVLMQHIRLIEKDLGNAELSPSLLLKLEKFKSLAEGLVKNCENHCDPEHIWDTNDISCLDLLEHPYAFELPFGIDKEPQFELLHSKNIIQTQRFLPFKKGVFSDPGKLFIVQDDRSASATEGFTSILQANDAAIVVGSVSYGAGCGYTNGGQTILLEHIGLKVQMPDCVRLRKDGKNEIHGIQPDIAIKWTKEDSRHRKGQMVLEGILEYLEKPAQNRKPR